LVGAACAIAPGPADRSGGPPEAFVIPTQLANGRVELTIRHAYALGATVTVPVAVTATRGTITGPLDARVLASGINEGGAPAEVLVRTLAVTSVVASTGQRRTTMVSWDGRDEHGALVPADAYSLVLEFRVDDAGAGSSARAGATLQMNAP
jgi:hypothetical protein